MPLKRFSPALTGLRLAFTQSEIQVHVLLGILVIVMGFLACLARSAWALLALAIGFVLVTEILNSALERALDALHPQHHEGIRLAKDLAAGAVLLAALVALLIGVSVLLPPFLKGTAGHCLTSALSGTIGR